MRIAILDLGTNTFHLLIADVNSNKFIRRHKSKLAVKLGEGAIHKNKIAPVPFKRGMDALMHYKELIEKNNSDKVFAFATSAIRGADNGSTFVKEAKEKTGIDIEIISGMREAEFICYGVRQCIKLKKTPALIMDIGGGSTEFIIADDKRIFWKESFNIGAARILEIFRPSNPVTVKEVQQMESFLNGMLQPLEAAMKKFPVSKLIGSSGSFDTFAEMIGYKFHGKNVVKSVNTYRFNLDEFYSLHDTILASTTANRMKMRGLIRMRVDMIVIASICTNYILRRFNLKEMHLSKFALKEGALWLVMNNGLKVKSKKSVSASTILTT